MPGYLSDVSALPVSDPDDAGGRHVRVRASLLLAGVGVLFATGRWLPLFRALQRWFAELR